ncbi:MAG: sugar ABC transporter ATP-binding protein [Planctomycetota bacterium]
MLRVTGLTKRFPGVMALDAVSLEVRAGEVHALVGENGAGKSTLEKILGGGLIPDAGEALLDGSPLPFGDPPGSRRRGLGIIYQELTLVPELSAAENIFLGRERRRRGLLARQRMAEEARALLDRLRCAIDPAAPVGELGVGQRQLVEVARALGSGGRLLVFDEPSATLTDRELERLFETIAGLRGRGLAIIYISHRLEEVFAIADRVTVLRDGRWVATAATSELDRPGLIRRMVGREVDESPPPNDRAPGETLLELRHLACPGRFHDVSFEARRGEILGLAGLMGAGRTSVGLALYGMLEPTEGEARLARERVRFRHPWEALQAGLGYLTEDRGERGIFAELSLAENITIANLEEHRRRGLLSEPRRRAAARDACARFDVRHAGIDRPIATLSGGNQQKALLARILSREVRVLILDEPTRGVDVGARAEIYRIIRSLAGDGIAVIVISSDLPELLGLCDRIAVLREGRTMGVMPREQATQESIMELATAEAPR